LVKRGRCFLLGALVAAFLVGCGSGGETATVGTTATTQKPPPLPPEILVTLDGYMGPQSAGLLVAEDKGYFDDLGLDVSLRSPVEPRVPVHYVVSRIDEIGVVQMPQVVLAKEKGAPVVAVGSVVQHPAAAMIWLPASGIQSVADLRGKTIATPGIPYQEEFLQTVLERAGLTPQDVKIRHVRFNLVPALLHGRADAAFGGYANLEGAALQSLGDEPVITPLSSLGIPVSDELVVLVRTDTLDEKPEMVRDFMAAVVRGTKFAVGHPKAAVRAIEEGGESNFKSTPKEVKAELKATLPLLSRSGRMDPAQTTGLVDWMQKQGQIADRLPASDLLTNEYLPQP
jgi:putative hydroxymethylpyrimidine transport system substrate-binding protein